MSTSKSPRRVYVEEGQKMVQAARKYKRIVQAGTHAAFRRILQESRRDRAKRHARRDHRCATPTRAGATSRKGYGNPPDGEPPAVSTGTCGSGPLRKFRSIRIAGA